MQQGKVISDWAVFQSSFRDEVSEVLQDRSSLSAKGFSSYGHRWSQEGSWLSLEAIKIPPS